MQTCTIFFQFSSSWEHYSLVCLQLQCALLEGRIPLQCVCMWMVGRGGGSGDSTYIQYHVVIVVVCVQFIMVSTHALLQHGHLNLPLDYTQLKHYITSEKVY